MAPFNLLPELVTVSCKSCNGEAVFETEYGFHICEDCNSTGEVEVCSSCLQVPEIFNGLEACGCVVIAKAA